MNAALARLAPLPQVVPSPRLEGSGKRSKEAEDADGVAVNGSTEMSRGYALLKEGQRVRTSILLARARRRFLFHEDAGAGGGGDERMESKGEEEGSGGGHGAGALGSQSSRGRAVDKYLAQRLEDAKLLKELTVVRRRILSRLTPSSSFIRRSPVEESPAEGVGQRKRLRRADEDDDAAGRETIAAINPEAVVQEEHAALQEEAELFSMAQFTKMAEIKVPVSLPSDIIAPQTLSEAIAASRFGRALLQPGSRSRPAPPGSPVRGRKRSKMEDSEGPHELHGDRYEGDVDMSPRATRSQELKEWMKTYMTRASFLGTKGSEAVAAASMYLLSGAPAIVEMYGSLDKDVRQWNAQASWITWAARTMRGGAIPVSVPISSSSVRALHNLMLHRRK